MNTRSCLLIRDVIVMSFVAISLTCLAANQGSAAPPAPAELLAILKARDAQLDNASLAYVMRGVKKYPIDIGSGRLPRTTTPRSDGFAELAYEFHDRMTVRGSDISFRRNQRPADISPKRLWTTMAWNRFDGIRSELVLYDERFTSTVGTLQVDDNSDTRISGEAQQRMSVELSLGIGFGKRFTKIETIAETPEGLSLEGKLQLWQADDTECELLLDQDFLVRRAKITSLNQGHFSHINVSTSGTVTKDGFLFAREGHYRSAMGRPDSNAETDFGIEFEDVNFHLSDQQHESLVTIEVPQGTRIVNPDKLDVSALRGVRTIQR